MADLIRDTVFGHFVRLITNHRYLQYAEERDPKLWKQYLDREQTKNMALYGNTNGPSEDEKSEKEGVNTPSGESSETNIDGEEREQQLSSTITGQVIDPEKGRDVTMVTWFGDNDPEVRRSRHVHTERGRANEGRIL